MKSEIYRLNLPSALAKEVRQAAKDTGLSLGETMRQSLKFGLPKVRAQLRQGRITNVDPLPAGVARRLYRQPEDDNQGIALFMAAQSEHIEE